MKLEVIEHLNSYLYPVSEIWADVDFNIRKEFFDESVTTMAQSITNLGGYYTGLQEPILIQPWSEQSHFKIPAGFTARVITGHRRFAAVKVLRWEYIPARLADTDLTEHDAKLLNYTENVERKDLNMIEEARGLMHLFPHGESCQVMAREIQKSEEWVKRRLVLLKFPLDVQTYFESGRLVQKDLDILRPHVSDVEKIRQMALKLIDAKTVTNHKRRQVLRELTADKKPSKTHPRRSKHEIADMIAYMTLDHGLRGLPVRVAAWCAGTITTEALKKDIASSKGAVNESNRD